MMVFQIQQKINMESSYFHCISCTNTGWIGTYTDQFFYWYCLGKIWPTADYFASHMDTISLVHRLNYYSEIWPVGVSQWILDETIMRKNWITSAKFKKGGMILHINQNLLYNLTCLRSDWSSWEIQYMLTWFSPSW